MELGHLFTIVSIVLAVFAVLPVERRLDLQLRADRLTVLLGATAFLTIHYIHFDDRLHTWIGAPEIPVGKLNLTDAEASYLVALLTVITLSAKLLLFRLGSRDITKLHELVEHLAQSRDWPRLLPLLQRHIDRLHHFATGEFPLAKLHTHLVPTLPPLEYHSTMRTKRWRFRKACARLLPSPDSTIAAAIDTLSFLMNNHGFVRATSLSRPALALRLLDVPIYQVHAFLDLFVITSLTTPGSPLHDEIRRNRNESGGRYDLDKRRRILYYLLHDAQKAFDLRLYRPIALALIREVESLARNPENDPYRRAPENDVDEEWRWESPLFVSVRLFDIMINEALYQGIEWHMSPYMLSTTADGIIRNYALADPQADPLYDPRTEWPTRYSYLLSEIMSVLAKPIRSLKHLPTVQANVNLKFHSLEAENDNIPKSCMRALAQVIWSILTSRALEDGFRRSASYRSLDLYRDLRREGLDQYASVWAQMLAAGSIHDSRNEEYRAALQLAFNEYDNVIVHWTAKWRQEFEEAFAQASA